MLSCRAGPEVSKLPFITQASYMLTTQDMLLPEHIIAPPAPGLDCRLLSRVCVPASMQTPPLVCASHIPLE